MDKITGAKQTLERISKALPGSISNYVPLDIDKFMPDEFVAVASEVMYDPANLTESFSPVGGGMVMPTTKLMYKIGEARGVIGGVKSESYAVYEEVDWSRMESNDPAAKPDLVKMKVGYKSIKQSKVLEPDGSYRLSNIWEVTYNVWERCCEDWSKSPEKHNTAASRRQHFDNEMKFAAQKAEYKAHSKTIRELAGLPTGYRQNSLTDGWMTFHKIQRSQEAVKLDAAARRSAMAKGVSDGGADATVALFGSDPVAALPEPEPSDDDILVDFDASPPQAEAQKPEHERARDALAQYVAEGFVNDKPAELDLANQMIEWINKWGEQCTTDPQKWQKVLAHIKKVEESVDDGRYVDHGLALS